MAPVAVEVDGHRDRAAGAACSLDGPAGAGLHRGEEPDQGVALGLALDEPDVAVGHGVTVPVAELRGGLLDQRGRLRQLPLEGGEVTVVGHEDAAGQAGVAFLAPLQGRQQAVAVGQEPVCAAGQMQRVVVFPGEDHAGAVGPELAGGQERLLGVLVAAGDVVHGHGRRGVARVALQDVDGQSQPGELGELGVPEAVGVAELDRVPGGVGDLGQLAEQRECPAVIGVGAGLGGVRVGAPLREQVRQVTAREAGAQPPLLFPDDRDGPGIGEDGAGRCADLALAVAEAGDRVSFRGTGGAAAGRGQAVEGGQADLAGAAAGEDLQEQHPHQLRVVLAGQHARAAAGGNGDRPGSRLAERGQEAVTCARA